MSLELPANAPKTTGEAFAYLGTLGAGATIDDLKILALTEVIGKALYDELASRAPSAGVRDLLLENGREELVHAKRLAEALEILTGKPFPLPSVEGVPFYTPLDPMPITLETILGLAGTEDGGEDLYARIAANFDDPRVTELLHQNGREETDHGDRLRKVAALLS